MATPLPVSPRKQQELAQKMEALGVLEQDLVEEFIRGSGAGGQKINKTSIVVKLTHAPSGLSVRCQQGRSQAMNRFYARRLLVEKIEEKIHAEKSARRQLAEKIRRQKRKRSKRAKEKVLEAKRRQSEKKMNRRQTRDPEE